MSEHESAKPWWQSVTVLAGIFMLLNAMGLAGLNIDWGTGEFSGNVYELWGSLYGMAGGAAAIFGRFRAKTRIGK